MRRSVLIGAAVVVALALVTGLVIRHSNKDRLAAGATRSGDYSISAGSSNDDDFMVPNAQIRVSVDIGQRGYRHNSDDDSDVTIRAPKGGVLVDLSWTSTSIPTNYQGTEPTRLSVRSGGRTVVLDPSLRPRPASAEDDSDAPEQVVALPGRPSDVELVADFAGRSQVVRVVSGRRTMGDFAPLYLSAAPGLLTSRPIGQDQPVDPRSPFRWTGQANGGQVVRVPYLSGQGWAPTGRDWILVQGAGYSIDALDPVVWTVGDEYARYSTVGTPKVTVTMDGRPPEKKVGAEHPGTVTNFYLHGSRDYVFSVARGNGFTIDTVVHVTTKRTSGDTRAPATARMLLRTSSQFPAAVDATVGGTR
ncbi:hypothetical protein [Flexivirga oryzae]|uniref:Uncharacterized protein n=1 Tax=Flexivirga oryzae TaxID=1794944 RepID=A0A839N4E0_9MICO|nr:hypothetical protein [Flexivirga oryzae]MBB2892630.1 hypothetical protein [Flexivirga oryzae]MBB2894523.1 hypothetical protein [Flexivirga oryzae]